MRSPPAMAGSPKDTLPLTTKSVHVRPQRTIRVVVPAVPGGKTSALFPVGLLSTTAGGLSPLTVPHAPGVEPVGYALKSSKTSIADPTGVAVAVGVGDGLTVEAGGGTAAS